MYQTSVVNIQNMYIYFLILTKATRDKLLLIQSSRRRLDASCGWRNPMNMGFIILPGVSLFSQGPTSSD